MLFAALVVLSLFATACNGSLRGCDERIHVPFHVDVDVPQETVDALMAAEGTDDPGALDCAEVCAAIAAPPYVGFAVDVLDACVWTPVEAVDSGTPDLYPDTAEPMVVGGHVACSGMLEEVGCD